MGKSPAVVIVARHGSRLDAADRQWHLTSPAPYDPPLTYSGWKQAHALGARIATILHHLDAAPDFQLPNGALKHPSTVEEEPNHSHRTPSSHRRKQKVIIHTSPFLRCVQTAVGISGGLVEVQASLNTHSNFNHRHAMHSAHSLHSGSPRIRAMEHLSSSALSAIAEPEDESEEHQSQTDRHDLQRSSKPHLRIDAFLGEWLSPNYYEDITHPPDSRMMVASAKANLLHEKNSAGVKPNVSSATLSKANFPGGWGSGKVKTTDDDDDAGPLAHLAGLNQSLPRLNRSGSHGSAGSLAHRGSFSRPGDEIDTSSILAGDAYVAPVPSYAISPVAPIPNGYVAFAKNLCVSVDYQWDSMRPPHEWGDGGIFGEEWSAMHKRFRHGLQEMITWYRQHDNTKHPASVEADDLPEHDDSENTDTVLIIVTHSAGCNALIGALTNQPVLLDAGLASLTMAVRKPTINGQSESTVPSARPDSYRRRSSIDLGLSESYDVKIMASTDHLRSGSSSSSRRSSRASSPGSSGQRVRSTTLGSTKVSSNGANGSNADDGLDGIGQLKRSSTAATPSSTGLWSNPLPNKSNGLWSKPAVPIVNGKSSHETSYLGENLTSNGTNYDNAGKTNQIATTTNALPPPLTMRGGHGTPDSGLWGAPPPASPSDREKGPKRRWTLHEHR